MATERVPSLRRGAWRRGLAAERRCVWHLRLRGWRVLARRLKTPVGEIDILARRGRVLAAIEVKARASLDEAAEAITPHQRRRVVRAMQWYIAGHPAAAGLDLRFDAMLVAPRRRLAHIAAAWRADE